MSTVVQQINQSPHKHNNILQQNTNSNQDRNIIVLKKQPHILPQPKGYTKDDILLTNTARKKTKSEKDSSGSKAYPQPIAVARRNARERNRVKQVNNGFANLRQHIPNFIAAAFESNNGRGTNKKLSKVETLRMAVEYIRSLEDVLAMDEVSTSSNEDFGSRSYPSTSPSINGQNMYYSVLSPEEEDDMASVTSTPSPQQFIRINNTYQIIPNGIYENSENMDPLIENHIILNDPSLIDSTLEFSSAQDLYLNSIHTNASLSPGMYSDEQSLSPNNANEKFIPIFVPEPGQQDIKIRLSSDVSGSEDLSVNESNELPVISLKTESDVPDEQKSNVIDVINWWEQQPSTEVS